MGVTSVGVAWIGLACVDVGSVGVVCLGVVCVGVIRVSVASVGIGRIGLAFVGVTCVSVARVGMVEYESRRPRPFAPQGLFPSWPSVLPVHNLLRFVSFKHKLYVDVSAALTVQVMVVEQPKLNTIS